MSITINSVRNFNNNISFGQEPQKSKYTYFETNPGYKEKVIVRNSLEAVFLTSLFVIGINIAYFKVKKHLRIKQQIKEMANEYEKYSRGDKRNDDLDEIRAAVEAIKDGKYIIKEVPRSMYIPEYSWL